MEYVSFQVLFWLSFLTAGLLIRNGHWRAVIVRQEYDVKVVVVTNNEDYMLPSSLMIGLEEGKFKVNL